MRNANATDNLMSYQILNKDRTLYTIQFIKKGENTELVVTEK